MSINVYRVDKPSEYRKAGPTDLLELLPAPGATPLFLVKWLVEVLVYAIASQEFTHLSGPTGTAKTSLLEALSLEPKNFKALCKGIGYPYRPLVVFPIEMACYESPAEIYQRRALKDGTTYDEPSGIASALLEASRVRDEAYPLVWLREVGRVHSSAVQGGLLNLVTKGDIILGDGQRISGQGIAYLADSNYQAESDSTHTLVTLDDALRRRLTVNVCMDYLQAQQEVEILRHLTTEAT